MIIASSVLVQICPILGAVVDFEDVGETLLPNSYWNGSPNNGGSTFDSGGFVFNNWHVWDTQSGWEFWSCFAYSNMTDSTTRGYLNQYSAITGSGASGSRTYAVSFVDAWGFSPALPQIVVPEGVSLVSAQVTNTTYAYYSMLEGDQFAKKFGGSSGNDPDWFKLTIFGKDLAGQLLGLIEFYLADFRFEDNLQDYIVNTWQTIDLTSIGNARILEFSLDSSDVGSWGMNTPAYFALDNLVFQTAGGNGGEVIPEPASIGILGTGFATTTVLSVIRRLRGRYQKKKHRHSAAQTISPVLRGIRDY